MHSRITPLLLASATLLFVTSCDQKDNSDASSPEAATMPEEQFVIAQRLVNDSGAYQLLTVIDGPQANDQFVKNLNLVRAQRMALKNLKDQAEPTEETTQKIEEIEKKLQENVDLMAKIYAYDSTSDYLFIPVKSALVNVVDDKKELVLRIDSPKKHHQLQALRAQYAEISKRDGTKSAEAETLAATLMEEFGYDVTANHDVDVIKGVLYRKVN